MNYSAVVPHFGCTETFMHKSADCQPRRNSTYTLRYVRNRFALRFARPRTPANGASPCGNVRRQRRGLARGVASPVAPPPPPLSGWAVRRTRKPPSRHTKSHEMKTEVGFSCLFVSGVRPAFMSGGHVEPVRARRMRRSGRDEVSRPHATRPPQIAAGDSTCPAGFRGRAKRQYRIAFA